jgi:hypothetical protein
MKSIGASKHAKKRQGKNEIFYFFIIPTYGALGALCGYSLSLELRISTSG